MKILCVGMNYAPHNKEVPGALYKAGHPVIFAKTENALLRRGKPFFVPDHLGRIDYEGELVVRVSRMGKNIPLRFAHRYYDAATVGVDFTARERQAELRREGLPWELCKNFDGAAAIGEWVPLEELGDMAARQFRLDINGQTRQRGGPARMTFSIDEIIAHISQWMTLTTGDMLFTGTPEGTGPVAIGDHIDGYIGDRRVLSFNCK